jgi:hypothetical protein
VPEGSPTLDYDLVDFPSDRITLRQLRALARADDPQHDLASYLPEVAEGLAVMHYLERTFADVGFARGAGDPRGLDRALDELTWGWKDDQPGVKFDLALAYQDAVADLASYYQRFGVADGPKTARELVRRLEESAAGLAPKSPDRGGRG